MTQEIHLCVCVWGGGALVCMYNMHAVYEIVPQITDKVFAEIPSNFSTMSQSSAIWSKPGEEDKESLLYLHRPTSDVS